MSEEIDLSGEKEPTEQMVEQQERAQEAAERDANLRDADHDGTVATDDFDVAEALSDL